MGSSRQTHLQRGFVHFDPGLVRWTIACYFHLLRENTVCHFHSRLSARSGHVLLAQSYNILEPIHADV